MSLISKLLRFARQVVANVTSQLNQQFNVVEQQALAPIRGIIGQVTGGVWKGDGATKFVEEVSRLMIPGVGRVGEQIKTLNGNLTRAVNVMDQADAQVNSLVRGLADVFGGIF
ncbi:MAG: hypothetical protein CVU38_17615 [Chloroflexi bacterium HGW-Chloroflexi-1]|nr:MAG: hypothetical protein CVU38_17615 [Chloroflexi bacterium HGW-Chloroflexi-1]